MAQGADPASVPAPSCGLITDSRIPRAWRAQLGSIQSPALTAALDGEPVDDADAVHEDVAMHPDIDLPVVADAAPHPLDALAIDACFEHAVVRHRVERCDRRAALGQVPGAAKKWRVLSPSRRAVRLDSGGLPM